VIASHERVSDVLSRNSRSCRFVACRLGRRRSGYSELIDIQYFDGSQRLDARETAALPDNVRPVYQR